MASIFNPSASSCAFALVTATTLALLPLAPAQAGVGWKYKVEIDKVVDIPSGNDFTLTLTADSIDSSVSTIDFTITYNPAVVTYQGFVVNSHTSPFDLSVFADPAGTGDNIIDCSMLLNQGDNWDNALADLADLTFRAITRDNSITADIAMLNVVARNASDSPVPLAFDSGHYFIIGPAPEPASLGLLSPAMFALLIRRRRPC